MMKTVTIVLCLSALVSTQEFFGFGDGLGGIFALNMLSRNGFMDMFGPPVRRPATYPQTNNQQLTSQQRQQQQQQAAIAAAAAASRRQSSPLDNIGGLLMLQGIMN